MKISYLILIVMVITACSKSNTYYNEYIPGTKQNNLIDKYAGINTFSEMFIYKEAITLEYNKESAISSIQKILFINDNIYILESYAPSIKCFRSDGKYSFKIGGKGKGPGEYMTPISMDVMDNILYVYDYQNLKLIKYNAINGNYINESNLNFKYDKIITQNNKIYLYKIIVEQQVFKNSVIDVYDDNCKLLTSMEISAPDKPDKFIFLPKLNFGFIKNGQNGIYYVNQCDLLLRYIDTKNNKINYGANELPKEVKLSEPPKLATLENMKKFGDDNSILYGLFYFNNGLVVEHMDHLFALYDSNGNYIRKIDVELKTYHCDSKCLYRWEQPSKNDINSNGKILKYELK